MKGWIWIPPSERDHPDFCWERADCKGWQATGSGVIGLDRKGRIKRVESFLIRCPEDKEKKK